MVAKQNVIAGLPVACVAPAPDSDKINRMRDLRVAFIESGLWRRKKVSSTELKGFAAGAKVHGLTSREVRMCFISAKNQRIGDWHLDQVIAINNMLGL